MRIKLLIEEIKRKLAPKLYMRDLHERLKTMPKLYKPDVWRYKERI